MATTIKFIFIFSVFFLSACSHNPAVVKPTKNKPTKNAGTILYFEETLPEEPKSQVRMIITDNYLRLDEGRDSEDFILFDRKKKQIFNVVKSDETVMVMSPEPTVNSQPPEWQLSSEDS
ncbi:MAG: hypothetical protein R3240_10780, partial [Gammaproteobacteria bacterium]|nr:hypothetical protein [Gammaproteobacteria bacterium]